MNDHRNHKQFIMCTSRDNWVKHACNSFCSETILMRWAHCQDQKHYCKSSIFGMPFNFVHFIWELIVNESNQNAQKSTIKKKILSCCKKKNGCLQATSIALFQIVKSWTWWLIKYVHCSVQFFFKPSFKASANTRTTIVGTGSFDMRKCEMEVLRTKSLYEWQCRLNEQNFSLMNVSRFTVVKPQNFCTNFLLIFRSNFVKLKQPLS